jgi:hypothetical protein
MNRERFEALAAAYGGAIARWPGAERRSARWFSLRHRRASGAILRDAWRLDQILDHSAPPELSVRLRGSLVEGAHGLSGAARERRSWLPIILGTGLSAACAAGIGAGFVIAPMTANDALTSPATDPAEVAASALGNPSEFLDV